MANTTPATRKAKTRTMCAARLPPRRGQAAGGGAAWSDADALGQQLAVVGRVPEQELARLGPLEIQVGVVLPGEADAAVDLDVLGGGVEVGVRAVGLGQGGDDGQLVAVLGRSPTGVVGGRLGRLDLEQHVGALVLDGLEGPDGPAELDA